MPHSGANHSLPSVERGARPPLRVGVILAHHFTLSAFAVFIDHLRLAADEGDRSRPLHVQWSIMSSRAESVPASCGVLLEPTSTLLSPELLDYVVVIGGILHAGPQIDETTMRYLREVGATAVPLIGICTGSFILCRAARAPCAAAHGADPRAPHRRRSGRGRARTLGAATRAALPAACRHRSGFALSAAAHALRELVDREHRPLRHGHRQRSGLRRLRALLTTIQGYIWPVALDAPPAAAPPHRRRRRACAGVRIGERAHGRLHAMFALIV